MRSLSKQNRSFTDSFVRTHSWAYYRYLESRNIYSHRLFKIHLQATFTMLLPWSENSSVSRSRKPVACNNWELGSKKKLKASHRCTFNIYNWQRINTLNIAEKSYTSIRRIKSNRDTLADCMNMQGAEREMILSIW